MIDGGRGRQLDAGLARTRGKAPAIVWANADVDLAFSSILAARHQLRPLVHERLLVYPDVIDDFTDRCAAAVAALRIGDPASPDVDLAPMANASQVSKTRNALDRALAEGARIVGGGACVDPGLPGGGYWQTPAVLRDVRPDMSIMRDETFVPITPIIAVADLDEAWALANDSRYGLSAYVFGENYRTVMRSRPARIR